MCLTKHRLSGGHLAKTTDGRADGNSGGGGRGVGTAGDHTLATGAGPDADISTLNRILTAELAGVLGVLRDFSLADGLSQRGTITSSVLSDDTDFLGSATLFIRNTSGIII